MSWCAADERYGGGATLHDTEHAGDDDDDGDADFRQPRQKRKSSIRATNFIVAAAADEDVARKDVDRDDDMRGDGEYVNGDDTDDAPWSAGHKRRVPTGSRCLAAPLKKQGRAISASNGCQWMICCDAATSCVFRPPSQRMWPGHPSSVFGVQHDAMVHGTCRCWYPKYSHAAPDLGHGSAGRVRPASGATHGDRCAGCALSSATAPCGTDALDAESLSSIKRAAACTRRGAVIARRSAPRPAGCARTRHHARGTGDPAAPGCVDAVGATKTAHT